MIKVYTFRLCLQFAPGISMIFEESKSIAIELQLFIMYENYQKRFFYFSFMFIISPIHDSADKPSLSWNVNFQKIFKINSHTKMQLL